MKGGSFLIVGLGNPGTAYARTRHNIGFRVIDNLAEVYRIPMRLSPEGAGVRMGKGSVGGRDAILAEPMSYMNLSGEPVYRILMNAGLPLGNMIVVHDDMDLSFGRIKIKSKGGSGGHNGVQSLIDALGEDGFNRLRIGIGRPGEGVSVVDHVLSPFSPEEDEMISRIIDRAREVVVTVLRNGAEAGMNRFNQTLIRISSQTTDGGK